MQNLFCPLVALHPILPITSSPHSPLVCHRKYGSPQGVVLLSAARQPGMQLRSTATQASQPGLDRAEHEVRGGLETICIEHLHSHALMTTILHFQIYVQSFLIYMDMRAI